MCNLCRAERERGVKCWRISSGSEPSRVYFGMLCGRGKKRSIYHTSLPPWRAQTEANEKIKAQLPGGELSLARTCGNEMKLHLCRGGKPAEMRGSAHNTGLFSSPPCPLVPGKLVYASTGVKLPPLVVQTWAGATGKRALNHCCRSGGWPCASRWELARRPKAEPPPIFWHRREAGGGRCRARFLRPASACPGAACRDEGCPRRRAYSAGVRRSCVVGFLPGHHQKRGREGRGKPVK